MNKHLAEALQQLGMTQQQAADLFGINDRTLRRYLRDEYMTPKLITIVVSLMLHRRISHAAVRNILEKGK